jgi:Right handed beta helix region
MADLFRKSFVHLITIGALMACTSEAAKPPVIPTQSPIAPPHPVIQGVPAIPTLTCNTDATFMAQWRDRYAMAFRKRWQRAIVAITIPPDAIVIQPGESIQAVVDQHPPGTAFVLEAGVHRSQSIAPKADMRFYGQRDSGGKRLTTLNGAIVVNNFAPDPSGKLYIAEQKIEPGQVHGNTIEGRERSAHPEDLFLNHKPLIHVADKAQVTPGKWHFDYAANQIYMADNPTGQTIELGTTRVAFSPSADGVTIAGLIIEKYAIPAQMGAIGDQTAAKNWQILGNEVRWNHGVGIRLNDRSVARDNYIHHNGQMGIGAGGTNITIERNEIAHNNYAQYDSGWEAGGSKFAFTQGLQVQGNLVYGNDGPGLWTDIDNRDTQYLDNVVYDNVNMGIFHEISHSAVIRRNYVAHNGKDDPWLYGANILISTSNGVVVEANTIEVHPDYGHGIGIIWQDRGSDYRSTDNRVFDNTIRYHSPKGRSGAAVDTPAGKRKIYQTNQFDRNTYYITTPNPDEFAEHYEWADQQAIFSQMQEFGQETHGREIVCPKPSPKNPPNRSRKSP